MAQAARPSAPNPSAAASRPALPLPTRRPNVPPPRAARPKDAPCPTSSADRGHSGQCKKAPEHATYRSSSGTYSKPDPRVKLIPAEDITYVRHGKPFSRSVGSTGLQKRHCQRSVTPPSSHRVSLARSTPLTQKPTTPAPPVASCLSPKRFETTENRKSVSLNRPSPVYKAAQRGGPISSSALHVKAQSSKVPLGTKAEPSSKSVSALDDRKLCSTSNCATVKCQRTRSDVDPVVLKEPTVELSLLTPTSVLNIRSAEVSSPSSRLNLIDGKCKLASQQPKTIVSPTQSVQSTTPAQLVELSNYSEVVPSTKSHITKQPETVVPPTQTAESITPAQLVELSNYSEVVPFTKSHITNERQTNKEASVNCNMPSEIAKGKVYQDVHPNCAASFIQDIAKGKVCQDVHPDCAASFTQGAPVIVHTKLHKKPYRPEACWKGKFEVTGELTHTCDGLEAHFPLEARFPLEIFIKVYEASKQMPETLKLEALPLSRLSPKIFKMEPPDGQDIGLCFISSLQRPNRNFDHLVENISSHTVLRTNIGTVELLIFSSKLLTKDDQTIDGKFYFWGVLLKHLRKKQRFNNHTNNVKISNPDSNAVVSNAAPAVSFFAGSCSPDSADSPCKSSRRAPAFRDPVLDSPPGFLLDVPPGFMKAHCGLRSGETAESYNDNSSSPVLDTRGFALDVSPGFTDAHRGLHTITSPGSENCDSTLLSEKKPPIQFCLNITRPVQRDVPPGFAKLLEVKKEPALPAVDKVAVKIPPIGKVNEMKIMHDKVNMEVEDSSEERELPKTKRLSDILGFSTASSKDKASTSLSTPRSCTDVGRSAPPVPETAGAPDKQKHYRKRGQQEPSEPPATAGTDKRLKVNRRIALNRCVRTK